MPLSAHIAAATRNGMDTFKATFDRAVSEVEMQRPSRSPESFDDCKRNMENTASIHFRASDGGGHPGTNTII